MTPFGESSELDTADAGRVEVSNAEGEETSRAGKRVRAGSEVRWRRSRATGAGDKRPARDSTSPVGVGWD